MRELHELETYLSEFPLQNISLFQMIKNIFSWRFYESNKTKSSKASTETH